LEDGRKILEEALQEVELLQESGRSFLSAYFLKGRILSYLSILIRIDKDKFISAAYDNYLKAMELSPFSKGLIEFERQYFTKPHLITTLSEELSNSKIRFALTNK
jgi:hypothetical protein